MSGARVDKMVGDQGAGAVSSAALDPRTVIKDPNWELACTLKRTLYTHSLYHFFTESLGVDRRATMYVDDPGVRETLDEVNAIYLDWMRKRMAAKARGEMASKTPRKLMLIQPRETMKSAGVTNVLPVLSSIWDPEIACAVSSYKFDNVASKFGQSIRDHWGGESDRSQLNALFGKFRHHSLPWNDTAAVISPRRNKRPDPTLRVFSVETGGTSGHYDLVILDDPVTQEQVEKYKDRWFEKCWEHYKSLGYITNQDGMFVLVMTRYGEGDLCGQIIEREIEKKVRELDLPGAPEGILPDDFDYKLGWIKYAHLAGWDVIYKQAWTGDIKSNDPADYTLHFPLIWPRERILNEMLKDELFVMAQLQNQPSERADRALDQTQIDSTWIKKVPIQAYSDLTIHCDVAWKSGEGYLKQKGDYNVIQVWGHHNGHAYLVWGRFGRWTQEEFGDHFVDAIRWIRAARVRRARLATLDRSIGGTGGSVKNYLQSVCAQAGLVCPPVAELNRGGTKKLDRILAASAFWADGRVHLQEGVPGAKELADQMLNIGYSRYDDLADAAADVFSDEVYRAARRTPIEGQLSDDNERLDWSPSIPMGDGWDEEEPLRIMVGGKVIEYPTEVGYGG